MGSQNTAEGRSKGNIRSRLMIIPLLLVACGATIQTVEEETPTKLLRTEEACQMRGQTSYNCFQQSSSLFPKTLLVQTGAFWSKTVLDFLFH